MLTNERGVAMIEIIPILTIFVVLINFSFGFFGIIHSGILQSISARNYSFETFRNRANLTYLRDTERTRPNYAEVGFRYHSVIKEDISISGDRQDWIVTQRPIKMSDVTEVKDPKNDDHLKVPTIIERKLATDSGFEEGINPVWVRVIYGICLNVSCGGQR